VLCAHKQKEATNTYIYLTQNPALLTHQTKTKPLFQNAKKNNFKKKKFII